jgi:hypothetical protein
MVEKIAKKIIRAVKSATLNKSAPHKNGFEKRGDIE